MHPNKKAGVDMHNAKLRRMTRDYGSASGDPNNVLAPMDRFKKEGPEQPVGFGADSSTVSARSDRPARRSMPANPLATYKHGGRVKKRADGGATDAKGGSPNSSKTAADTKTASNTKTATSTKTSTVANPKGNVTVTGGAGDGDTQVTIGKPSKQAVRERAFGGRLDGLSDDRDFGSSDRFGNRSDRFGNRNAPKTGKGAATVNVIIAPQGGAQANPGMVPPPAGPPVPPASAPPPPPAAPMGGMPPPPGGMPPGMIPPRAKGGRIDHPDAAQDKALIENTLKDNGLVGRANGGPVSRSVKQMTGYTAGAGSGEGRLEKIANYGKRTSNATPQKV